MRQKDALPDINRDNIQFLSSPENEKHFQPDEQGHNLYFTKEESERYHITPECRVNQSYFVRQGHVEWMGHAQLGGFSKSELLDFAEDRGWDTTDKYDSGRWSYSFEESNQGTTVTIDEPSVVDGEPLNNVFVRSREIALDSDLKVYDQLQALATQQNMEVAVRDSEGLWQRLKNSSDIEAPDLEVLSQIIKKVDTVRAHIKFQFPSVWMTLEQLGVLVDQINEAMETVPDDRGKDA